MDALKLELPVSKLNILAAVLLVVLLIFGKVAWCFWLALGWSLRDDGKVYSQVRAMVARRLKRES